jgi:1-acyl-sn-glycerol-3-phosphate acyltransferase
MALCTLVLGPPLILLTLVTKSATLMYWAGVKMVVCVTRIAGEKVTVIGRENIPPGVCMFAANHTSNADAPAIVGAIPRRVAIFGRKSLFDIPVVGTAFRLAKFVPVDREDRDAALASVKQAVGYMKEGYSFLVYPEGTRSPDGRLGRFKKGSFVIAIEAGIPIVPVACAGAHRIMPKHSLIVHPGQVTVRFGKPIDASAFTVDRRDELAQLVHDAVAADLPEDQKPAM